MKIFYVCSYGGCGSVILTKYLSNFGSSHHIHSRNPPDKLEYVGRYQSLFNGVAMPENEVNNYYVIYIYRDPVKAIYSRFENREHLINIQCKNVNIKIEDVIKEKRDLYGIKEFYNNYTKDSKNRNYNIYCIKYEDMFDNMEELNELLDINLDNKIKMRKKESGADNQNAILEEIYGGLKEEMKNNKFIEIKTPERNKNETQIFDI